MTEEAIKEDLSTNAISEDAVELNDEISNEDDLETQIYELGFHIVPTVEATDLEKEINFIKSIIDKNGGIVISEEFPKQITLAYTISKSIDGKLQKFDTASFGWIKFEMKTNNILNLKEEADADKNILRYLIIKTVRESTLVSKDTASTKTETTKNIKPKKTNKTADLPTDKKKEPISEEELDKTIEELIS